MSTKVAVVIGDYSNGWSDAWVVQLPLEGINQAKIGADRTAIMAKMTAALEDVTRFILSNEKINPVPQDEPCCGDFADWFKSQPNKDETGFCGKCGKRITSERAKKYASGKDIPF